MRCVDVNVLVYAHRQDLPDHAGYRELMTELANDDQPLGLSDMALSGYLRVVTSRRIFNEPTSTASAWQQIDTLLAAPATIRLRPGPRHWDHFRALAQQIDAHGNDVPDAFLAAYAVENNATWLSADRGFARFRGLRWRHPLDTT